MICTESDRIGLLPFYILPRTAVNEPLSERGGLELYVNDDLIGHAPHPLDPPLDGWAVVDPSRPEYSHLTTRTAHNATQRQARPLLMLGCHRNTLDSQFRDFALPGSKMDEFAWWGRRLQVNRTHNEIKYFTGGYGEKRGEIILLGLHTSQTGSLMWPAENRALAALLSLFNNFSPRTCR